MILIIVALCIMNIVWLKMEFKFDTLPNGDKILWYNSGGNFNGGRDYFIYKKKK